MATPKSAQRRIVFLSFFLIFSDGIKNAARKNKTVAGITLMTINPKGLINSGITCLAMLKFAA